MSLNHDQLLSFAVFADHLNFTRAASALHISQPALHVKVRKLGESIGVPLYHRDGRGLVLTDAGRRVAAHARSIRASGDALLAELRGESVRAPVTLASGRGLYLYVLPPIVRRFPRERWKLVLRVASASDALAAVADGRADVAITLARQWPEALRVTRLGRVGQRVVVPRGHRLASRKRVRVGDLDGESLVAAPANRPHRQRLEAAARAAGIAWTVAVEADGWALMLALAASGAGIAVVNDICPVPARMVGIPLVGVEPIEMIVARRPDCQHPGAETLEASARRARE